MLQDSNVEVEIPKDPSKPDHLQPTEPSLWEMDNAMERGKLIVSYEKKASYGVKFTYYTEKIEDHFYY